jgi:hypothetical protein
MEEKGEEEEGEIAEEVKEVEEEKELELIAADGEDSELETDLFLDSRLFE